MSGTRSCYKLLSRALHNRSAAGWPINNKYITGTGTPTDGGGNLLLQIKKISTAVVNPRAIRRTRATADATIRHVRFPRPTGSFTFVKYSQFSRARRTPLVAVRTCAEHFAQRDFSANRACNCLRVADTGSNARIKYSVLRPGRRTSATNTDCC